MKRCVHYTECEKRHYTTLISIFVIIIYLPASRSQCWKLANLGQKHRRSYKTTFWPTCWILKSQFPRLTIPERHGTNRCSSQYHGPSYFRNRWGGAFTCTTLRNRDIAKHSFNVLATTCWGLRIIGETYKIYLKNTASVGLKQLCTQHHPRYIFWSGGDYTTLSP